MERSRVLYIVSLLGLLGCAVTEGILGFITAAVLTTLIASTGFFALFADGSRYLLVSVSTGLAFLIHLSAAQASHDDRHRYAARQAGFSSAELNVKPRPWILVGVQLVFLGIAWLYSSSQYLTHQAALDEEDRRQLLDRLAVFYSSTTRRPSSGSSRNPPGTEDHTATSHSHSQQSAFRAFGGRSFKINEEP